MAVSVPSFPSSCYTPIRDPSRCGDAANRSPPCDGACCVPAAVSRITKRDSHLEPPPPPKPVTVQVEGSQVAPCEGQSQFEPGTSYQAYLPCQAKRIRDAHDVDGPGTDKLPVKKRRLLLRLVTSRLSQPFSEPATHILLRESGGTMPVLHRIQQIASLGGCGPRRAGHQSIMVRKAAIMNRIRICLRQAAVARGQAIMAELAARDTALNHGLQLVPTGTQFPMAGIGVSADLAADTYGDALSPTGSSGPNCTQNFSTSCGEDHRDQEEMSQPDFIDEKVVYNSEKKEKVGPEPTPTHPSISSTTPFVPPKSPADVDNEEEDNTAFPAASFHDRYVDLSDEDMDDVYADFEVLFGPGSSSPEGSPGPVDEPFFEEYLDGIPWVM